MPLGGPWNYRGPLFFALCLALFDAPRPLALLLAPRALLHEHVVLKRERDPDVVAVSQGPTTLRTKSQVAKPSRKNVREKSTTKNTRYSLLSSSGRTLPGGRGGTRPRVEGTGAKVNPATVPRAC